VFKEICYYCFVDTNLLYLLNIKQNYVRFILAKANLCNISLYDSANSLASVPVNTIMYELCLKNNVVPDVCTNPSNTSYGGGAVLEPKRKVYRKKIASLDYSALYPSCMQADNVGFSTTFFSK